MTAGPRKAPVRFRERAELLDFLLEVARIAEILDIDQLLEGLAAVVKDVVPYELFAILLYSERNQGLRIRYSIGHREELVRNLIIPLNEGIVGAAASAREPVVVDDVHKDPRYLNALDAVRSEMAVPMIARGRLVGVIDVQSTRPKAYGKSERAMLSLVASRVAAAVYNAGLYRKVERQNRTLRTLTQLSQEFSSILDLDELLGKIAAAARAIINYDAFSIFLVDAERSVLRHRFSVRYDQRVNVDNIPLGKGITGAAVETRDAVRVPDTSADPRYISLHANIRSELAVPLIVQDRVIGVLNLESERPAFFTEDHQRTLLLLGPQIAISVENARLYEELQRRQESIEADLKAARKLQRVLLPRTADLRGLEVGIRARPAREITGDFYDVFEFSDDDAIIAFGDVSGKGAAAALYGAMIGGLLRSLAPRRRSPSLLLRSLNEALLERRTDATYATITVALWQPRQRRFVFGNAGGGPVLVWRNGEILRPRAEGVPIGLLEGREYEEVEFKAELGDTLLFYSDGVEDQLNADDQDFSRPRVARFLQQHGNGELHTITGKLFAELDEFRAAWPITDDQSVILLRVVE
jgi:sigma-B regulation protein RsbU (phosphoserine phosphatase)